MIPRASWPLLHEESMPHTVKVGDVLVVFDDSSRFEWCRSDIRSWQLVGIWPRPSDRPYLHDYVNSSGRMAVITAGSSIVTTILQPEDKHELVLPPNTIGDPIVDLEITAFDWLPESFQERGHSFVAAQKNISVTPFCSPRNIAIDKPSASGHNVRFALRRSDLRTADLRSHLTELIDMIFSAN